MIRKTEWMIPMFYVAKAGLTLSGFGHVMHQIGYNMIQRVITENHDIQRKLIAIQPLTFTRLISAIAYFPANNLNFTERF